MGPLDLEFMRWAYAVGLVVGLVAPLAGLLLVERRMSLIGDGLGHLAFAGVGAGLVLGVEPILAALVVSILGALAIEALRAANIAAGDRALALLFYTGLAGGVVLASRGGGLDASINSFLFGSILTVDGQDLALASALGVTVVVALVILWRALTAVAIDEEGLRVSGAPVAALNALVAVLAAVTVAASIQTVGVLLIGAIMVLPVLAASLLAWSLRSTAVLGSLIGGAVTVAGLTISYYADLAPGGSIVLTAAAVYVLALVGRNLRGAT